MIAVITRAQVGLWAARDFIAANRKDERGEANIVAVLIGIGIVVLVAAIAFAAIKGLGQGVADNLEDTTTDLGTGGAFN